LRHVPRRREERGERRGRTAAASQRNEVGAADSVRLSDYLDIEHDSCGICRGPAQGYHKILNPLTCQRIAQPAKIVNEITLVTLWRRRRCHIGPSMVMLHRKRFRELQ
jgi:hypothetical protein